MKRIMRVIFNSVAITLLTSIISSCGGSGAKNDVSTEKRSEFSVVDDELITIEDIKFEGAFRLKNGAFGVSSINYAVGTLAYNPQNESLFIVGHANQSAIAEYFIGSIVPSAVTNKVADLPETDEPIQYFTNVLDVGGNPEGINRVTGMLWVDGALIVNAETWYDAPGKNRDTTVLITDANNLAGNKEGYFELSCRAKCAGYMGTIPSVWQDAFDAQYYAGWSSVYSIISRYSVGPSLWIFDPDDIFLGNANTAPEIEAVAFMNFGYPDALSERAFESASKDESGPFPPADPLWNHLSNGRYGFFVEGTRTFAVIGSSGGINSGIGYKITQRDGRVCGGHCPYEPGDLYNYYWLFDVQDILDADIANMPKPYAYGVWEMPFDASGKHRIIGATIDTENRTLYVALRGAGKLGTTDYPPLILTYELP